MTEEVWVERKRGSDWKFKEDERYTGLIHRTNLNVYRLFFEDPLITFKPIWIGRLGCSSATGKEFWYTVEKEIGATRISFCGSIIMFT